MTPSRALFSGKWTVPDELAVLYASNINGLGMPDFNLKVFKRWFLSPFYLSSYFTINAEFLTQNVLLWGCDIIFFSKCNDFNYLLWHCNLAENFGEQTTYISSYSSVVFRVTWELLLLQLGSRRLYLHWSVNLAGANSLLTQQSSTRSPPTEVILESHQNMEVGLLESKAPASMCQSSLCLHHACS